MAVFLHIVATESSNAIRDAITGPTQDAAIASSFQYVERGDLGGRSRTPLNGGWVGAFSLFRNPDGTAVASRTWGLTDAQMRTSGLTSPAAVQAFAQRLADDVHAELRAHASRNRGGAIGDFWNVSYQVRDGAAAPVPTLAVGAPAAPSGSSAGWWIAGGAVAAVLAWVFWPTGRR